MFLRPTVTKGLAAAVAATTILALTACGSPLQDDTSATASSGSGNDLATTDLAVFKKFAAMDEPDRTTELVKAAKEEGQVNLYGSSSLQVYADAFTKKYGIKVTLYESDTDTAVARLTQEAKAGKYIVDYIDGGSTFLNELDNDGLLGEYDSQYRQAVPAEDQGEHWTAQRRQPFVAAYNTDEIDPSEIPDDYLDFADPKWKGKISMELGDYDWYQGLVQYYMAQGMSRDEVDEKFAAIASNARTADGHSDQAELLAAGQFAVTLSSYVHHIEELKADGAPVEWGGSGKPTVQPIIMRYEGVALMSHSPHPAAATLFMDFVLSPEGVALLEAGHDLPAVPEDPDPLAGLNISLLDLDEYAKNSDQWSKDYDQLLRDAH